MSLSSWSAFETATLTPTALKNSISFSLSPIPRTSLGFTPIPAATLIREVPLFTDGSVICMANVLS